ncbi:zinc ribbon domain-containing protein [Halosolutus amylolyticus]|uniref:Zinc ribbon domain-containing protein n=1 Tax=Halosolutus amylolyticus TaxID=2932267 RepID=A0ABD5PNE0_9EURY|nr:zinc ribbon domain-containing protein [Halosolutus amylolyticus]
MDDPGTYSIAGRLAMAGFVMIAPTLLFLGLVRGLERLRDDAFLAEWARKQGRNPDDIANDDVLAALARGAGIEADESNAGRCPACGSSNRSDVTYCGECLARLS